MPEDLGVVDELLVLFGHQMSHLLLSRWTSLFHRKVFALDLHSDHESHGLLGIELVLKVYESAAAASAILKHKLN